MSNENDDPFGVAMVMLKIPFLGSSATFVVKLHEVAPFQFVLPTVHDVPPTVSTSVAEAVIFVPAGIG